MSEHRQPYNLVVTLTHHPSLGFLLMPYTTEESSDNTIRLAEYVGRLRPSFATKLTDVEQKIIQIAAAYSEKNLMKVFSRETSVPAFLKKMTEDIFKKMVRPFIDKKLLEMLELLRTERIPFYQNEKGNKLLFEHNKISVPHHHTESMFAFEADSTCFHYSLHCQREGQPVSLLGKKPVVVLTTSPASVLLGNDLHLFQNINSMRIIPFTNKSRVSVAVSETDKYLEKVVFPILRFHNITFSGLDISEEKRTCEPRLSVEENIYDMTVLRLSFHYDDEMFYPGSVPQQKSARMHKDENGKVSIRYFRRDLPKERQLAEALSVSHLVLIGDSYYRLRQNAPEKDMDEWISANRPMLTKHFRLLSQYDEAPYCLDEIRIEQDITEERDWFELHIMVEVGAFRIPFIRFRKHILTGKKEYILPDGRVLLLPEEWFSRYTNVLEHSEKSPKNNEAIIQLKSSFIGLINSTFGDGRGRKKRSYHSKEHIATPKNLKAKLRNYQEEGFNWMLHLHKHHFGGCLADDMGLGKTLQTLSLLQYIYDLEPEEQVKEQVEKKTSKSRIKKNAPPVNCQLSLFDELTDQNTLPCPVGDKRQGEQAFQRKPASLVVMPTSLLHNWRKEIKRFTTLRAFEFTGNGWVEDVNYNSLFDRYHLILISYGMMRNHIDTLRHYRFEYVVLDESQHIKNSDSQTFKMAILLRSNFRITLTGTPIENSLKDLWSQFHFLQPDLLGSEHSFQKQFILPIKQGSKRIESKLQQLTTPFLLRRSKKEVAPELPQLTEEIIYCEMTEKQKEVYEKEKNSLRNLLLQMKTTKEKASNFTALNGISLLRQLACHPRMVNNDYEGTSGKLQEIVSTFETLKSEGHKVLIFSSFVKHLNLVAEMFDENGWPYALLTGASTDREKAIKRFVDTDSTQAFLISLKAGGVGLNLPQADYVFIIDPWWNPAAELQAIGRAHRIGQEKHVFAYRFITESSIEEKIVLLQDEKKEIFDTFITESNPLKKLSDKEWASLLGE